MLRRRPLRRLRLGPVLIVVLVSVLVATGVVIRTIVGAREGVGNGSVLVDTSGWDVRASNGPIELSRAHLSPAPARHGSGAEIRQNDPGPRQWARAMVDLTDPVDFLRVGRSYRVKLWARDLSGSGRTLGVLLANENYQHRPADSSLYVAMPDVGWHQLVLDLTVVRPASADTAVYLSLPTDGPIHWQVTGVSVQQADHAAPPRVDERPDRTLGFDGPAGRAVDPAVWTHDLGAGGWGNDELQTYTDRQQNSSLTGQGQLRITARRDDDPAGTGYTSARLSTRGKVEIQPGSYVESTILAPVGSGVWPAFWTLGAGYPDTPWPAAGEIDIVEVVGSRSRTVRSNLHMPAADDTAVDRPYGEGVPKATTELAQPTDVRPHRYGVFFDRDEVVVFLDRKPTLTYTAAQARSSGRIWPFGDPQVLLLNIAVGGREDPAATVFPRSMLVGPIQVWYGGVPF